MSTLILQIDIGDGTQWNKDKTIDPIRKLFIPSVKKYAKKNNYNYLLITKSKYASTGGDFNFLATKEKHFSFERYYHLNNEYDQIVYIDNDVYVFDHAEPLPKIRGLMVAPEPELKSSKIFRNIYNLSSDQKYYNSGVTMLEKENAIHLQDYMLKRMIEKKRAKGKNSDNMMLNEYILEYPEKFEELESKWNYMPFLDNKRIIKPNFFHFVGINGKLFLNFLQKQKGELEDTINKMVTS